MGFFAYLEGFLSGLHSAKLPKLPKSPGKRYFTPSKGWLESLTYVASYPGQRQSGCNARGNFAGDSACSDRTAFKGAERFRHAAASASSKKMLDSCNSARHGCRPARRAPWPRRGACGPTAESFQSKSKWHGGRRGGSSLVWDLVSTAGPQPDGSPRRPRGRHGRAPSGRGRRAGGRCRHGRLSTGRSIRPKLSAVLRRLLRRLLRPAVDGAC